MNVLQIACGVSYTKIYYNLFLELKKKGAEFEVYIPQHDNYSIKKISKREFPFTFYSNKVIKPYDKFLYYSKIRRMTKDVEKNFNLSKISIIHSHSLFSDGAVAYELYKKYKIPYLVAIRDTDVNQYFKKAIHLRNYALKILNNSSNIIFLSKSYRDRVLDKYVPNKLKKILIRKVRVIPNGIDSFWLNNKYNKKIATNEELIKILFVGQIIKRKNIIKIIEASKLIEKKWDKKVSIVLVGKKQDVDYFNQISNKGSFKYIPYLPKEKLISYYRNSDIFVMPSITETFGLVYAEAMSQGLPIIYTKDQGFDKQFNEGEVGYSVNPMSANDIADKVKSVIENREEISFNCVNKVEKFDWQKIAQEYIEIYSSNSVH